MKILALWIFSFRLLASPEYFTVSAIKETSRLGYFSLVTSSQGTSLDLDCSSFLHGLQIAKASENRFFYLYEPECYDLMNSVKENQKSGELSCLEVDFESHSWEVFTGNETCQSSP